jgi:hypothetical protein
MTEAELFLSISRLSLNGINFGSPQLDRLGNAKDGSTWFRELSGVPAIAFWIASCEVFKYFTT